MAAIETSRFLELKGKYQYINNELIRNTWNTSWHRFGQVFPELADIGIFSRNACVFPISLNNVNYQYGLIFRKSRGNVKLAYSSTPVGLWIEIESLILPNEN